jgi:hypothetical protein
VDHSGETVLPIEQIRSDDEFRRVFEREWNVLLRYRGVKFDFRVVPKLSPDALVRYQKLRGGNKTIRRIISTYVVHQATVYPHLPCPAHPSLVIGSGPCTGRGSKRCTPVGGQGGRQVLVSLATDDNEAKRLRSSSSAEAERLRADVTAQVWQVYDKAVQEFRFHVPYSGTPSPWEPFGILGLAESQDERDSFDAYLEQIGGSGGDSSISRRRVQQRPGVAAGVAATSAPQAPDKHHEHGRDAGGVRTFPERAAQGVAA